MREIEIKLRITDMTGAVAKLQQLGCAISAPITQTDINFVHKDDVRWFESVIEGYVYPRLRMQDGKPITLTVKKPIKNEMDCQEHELHVDDADEMRAIFGMFDFVEGVTVIKTRRTCTYKDHTFTLDEVAHLGSFMEIERVVPDGDAEKIQEEMFRFAKETFGLEKDLSIMKGYDILTYHFLQSKKR